MATSEEKKDWFFTFGVNHYPYHKNYVKIHGTFDSARAEMVERFGLRWCMQYDKLEDVHADEWNLTEYKEK